MIEMSPAERRSLRAAAHHLNPVVAIAVKGLSPAVMKEIDASLKAHELIKVKLHGIERDRRTALLEEICAALGCAPVQQIGNILVLWRKNPEQDASASKPRRKTPAPRTKKEAAAALERPTRRRLTRT